MIISKGFTIIELLVVISIIGLLAAVGLVAINQTRAKARDIRRVQDLKSLQTALELYFHDYAEYPKTFEEPGPYDHRWICDEDEAEYITGLVPQYLGALPGDLTLDCDGVTHGWIYSSNGKDYKLITHSEETYSNPELIDPAFDWGVDPCVLDNTNRVHIGVWTPGAVCWPSPYIAPLPEL